MALWKITIKRSTNVNSVRLEQGMSIQMACNGCSDPLGTTQFKDQIAQLFMNNYGIDLKKANAVNRAYLESERLDK